MEFENCSEWSCFGHVVYVEGSIVKGGGGKCCLSRSEVRSYRIDYLDMRKKITYELV